MQGAVDPLTVITVLDQAVKPYRGKYVAPGAGYPVDTQIRTDHRSDREGGSATAGGARVWVPNDKLGALQAFRVINLRAHQVLEAEWIDQQGDAVIINRNVIFGLLFVEGESVLETGTATAGDVDPQFQLRIALFEDQFLHLAGGCVREYDARHGAVAVGSDVNQIIHTSHYGANSG